MWTLSDDAQYGRVAGDLGLQLATLLGRHDVAKENYKRTSACETRHRNAHIPRTGCVCRCGRWEGMKRRVGKERECFIIG
jgi:hypothetical protein